MTKIACGIIVKNAGSNFAEWIAYQFAIGFDAVFILDNSSTDETKHVAESFAQKYDVRVCDWALTDKNFQRRGYAHIIKTSAAEFEWCACIDADEFIVLPEGRNLQSLVDVQDDVSAIAMSWAIFGSCGHESRPSDLIIRSYLRRALPTFGPNLIIKSIVRTKKFEACRCPHFFDVSGEYVDMAHRRVFLKGATLNKTPDYNGGKLHHYFVQSKSDWAAKMARGHHGLTRTGSEFEIYDRNEVFDDGALQYEKRVVEILNHMQYKYNPETTSKVSYEPERRT